MAIKNTKDELSYRWKIVIGKIKNSKFNPNDRIALLVDINNLLQIIDTLAIEENKELSSEYILRMIKKCHSDAPKKIKRSKIDLIKSLNHGFTHLRSGISSPLSDYFWRPEKLSKPQQLAAGTYRFLNDTIDAICETLSPDDIEHTGPYDTDTPQSIIGLCEARAGNFSMFDQFNKEQNFINLCLYLMKNLCDYVIEYPQKTLAHDRHDEASSLLEFTNDLMLKYRDISPIKRTIMIIDRLHAMDQYKNGNVKELIQNIQCQFFGEQNTNVSNPTLFAAFKLNHSYYAPQHEYEKDATISNKEIISRRNNVPYLAIKQHLQENPKNIGFFARVINWFYTTVNRRNFEERLSEIGFLREQQFCKVGIEDLLDSNSTGTAFAGN